MLSGDFFWFHGRNKNSFRFLTNFQRNYKILSIKLSIKVKLTELSIWPFMCAREMEKEERAIQDSVKIGNRTILVKKKSTDL